jgi:amidase
MAVGRTKTSELGLAATVETAWRGRTRNPWDPSRTAGGSSGGSAAAVAAGIVPVAHGSDGGGSIRIPASCCGVVGLKPSRGRISAEPVGGELGAMNTQFVLTRTVRDAAVVLDAVHGVAPWEMAMAPRPPGRTWAAAVGERPRLAVGVTTGHFWGRSTDPEVASATERTGRELARLGHRVRAVPAPRFDAGFRRACLDVWCAQVAAELDAAATTTARRIGPTLLEGPTLAWYEHGRGLAAVDVVGARQVLHDASRALHQYFEQRAIDVLCSPTIPSRPPPLGSWDPRATREAAWYYEGSVIGDLESTTSAFNCSGQPAISLPLHQSAGGLPIGIHLAARFGHEEMLFSLAGELEQEMPWADRHPLAWVGAPR